MRIKYIYLFSLALLTCSAVLLTNCNRLKGGGLGDMIALKDTLSSQLKISQISVNITNGKYLSVGLINSPYNDSSSEVQKKLALQIGETAYNLVGKKNHLVAGRVNYISSQNFFIFHSTSTRGVSMELSRFTARDTTAQTGM